MGFLYRATQEGFVVGKPFGGAVRYDVMVDGGTRVWRVQVKSTVRLCRRNVWEVRAGRQVERGKLGPKAVAYTKAEIDFLAVLVVREGLWYIFPVEELRGRTRLTINSVNHPRQGANGGLREKWELFRKCD
jgi:hypothetical protein